MGLLRKIINVLLINSIIILLFIVIIELCFGYWFDKNNFGPHMREHRMKNQRIVWQNENEKIEYFYRRNYHGFRGADIDPSEIEGVILGGSVIDERYKPEKYTITEFLNKRLKNDNIDIKFINGGVEAQSTMGLISGFNNWLFKLKNFSPKVIIFYVGINDKNKLGDDMTSMHQDGFILNPDKKEVFKDNIKSRSIIYDSLRKLKFKYLPRKGFIKYDGKLSESYLKNYNFIEHEYAKKNYNYRLLKEKYSIRIKNYLNRIDLLAKYSNKINSMPVFVNNINAQGHSEIIYILNKALINHCIEKNYNCIDLASKLTPQRDLWYDGDHTTKKGSSLIADIIFSDLKKIITKSN